MKKKAIKIATASAIAASGFVAVAPTQSEAAPNVKAEVSRAKTVMYNAMYAYSKPFVATGEMVDQAVVYAAYKKGEAQYKYAVSVVNKYAPAKEKAALLADLDKVRKNYLLGRALNYIKAFNALELHVEKAAKELEAALATNDEAKIKEAKANLEKVYEAQKADLNKVVESSIKAHVNESAATVVETAKAAAEKKLEEIAVPKVVEVSAINAKTLKVAVSKELTSLDGLTFTVKRGTSTVVLTPKLSEDKKFVELSSSTNLVAGDYTVTVTGGKFEEGKNVGTVKVEAQKIGKIEFNGETLAKTGTGTATVSFKVYDQYGTDVTGEAASLVNAINWSANVAVDSLNDANGVLTIDLQGATDFVKDQKILITAVDSATGVSKAVNFSVGEASSVKTLSLGDVKLPKDTTRVYTGSSSAATIEITAEDQYGNKLDKASKLTGISVLSSDSGVVASITDVDNKPVINLNTNALTTAKSVTITVVINATGQTVTKVVDVVQPAQPDTVTLGNLETNVVASGDAAGKFVLPITVVNQFGETMTAKQIADAFSAGKLTVTGTGSLGTTAALTVDTNTNSVNYGKVVNGGAIPSTGVGTVVVTTATGKTASANFEAKAARKVTEIVAPKTVTTNLVSGASSTFAYQYKDQYGDLITPAATNRNGDLTWKFVVTDLTGDAGVISVDKTTGADEDSIGNVTVSSAAGKAGTAKVAAQLLNASNEVVSQVETTFKVSANNAAGLTYSVGDVKTLYSDAAGDTAVDGTDAYAAPLTIKATDASGNEYAIPSSQIIKVESVKGFFNVNGTGDAPLGDVAIDAQDNKFVIGAKDAGSITWPSGSNTVTDTLRVTLNTADGIKVLTKDVTISKEAPKTTELKIVDKAITAANPYALATNTKDVTALTFDDLADAITGTESAGSADAASVFVVTKDQYGVYRTVAKDFVVNSVGSISLPDAPADKFATTALGAFTLADADSDVTYAVGKDIILSVFDGDYTDTLTVKINSIANLTATASAKTVAAGGGTTTFTFNRPLNSASKDAVVNALKAKATATTPSTAAAVTYTWNPAGTILTLTNNHASEVVSFTADTTVDLTDTFGNKTTGVAFDIQ